MWTQAMVQTSEAGSLKIHHHVGSFVSNFNKIAHLEVGIWHPFALKQVQVCARCCLIVAEAEGAPWSLTQGSRLTGTCRPAQRNFHSR